MLTSIAVLLAVASLAHAYTEDLRPLLNRHYRARSDRWYRSSNATIKCFSTLNEQFMDKTLTLDGGKRFGGDTPCDVRLPANVLVKFTKLSFAHPKSNVRVEAGQTSTVPAVFSKKAFKNEKEIHYGPWRIPCKYVYISLNPQAKDESVAFYFYRTVGMQPDPELCTF